MSRPAFSLGLGWFAVLAVVAGAAVIRIVTLQQSLWLDELHTSWVVSSQLSQVAERAADGNQSPWYFWLVWGSVQAFGHHEVALRIPSLLAGLLTVASVMYVAARWTRSTWLGVVAGVAVATDVHFVYFAREARPYALLQLAAVWQLVAWYRQQRHPSWGRRGCWIVLTWVLFYLHYTSMLVLPAQILWATIANRRTAAALRRTTADLVVILIGCLPAWGQFARVFARRENWTKFVSANSVTEIGTMFPLGLYVALPAVLIVILAVWDNQYPIRLHRRFRRHASLILLSYVIPVVTAWTVTRVDWVPLFFRRYLLVASIPLVLGVACWGTLLRRPVSRAVYSIVWCLIASSNLFSTTWSVHTYEDWRSAIRNVSQQPTTLPVLLRSGLIEDEALNLEPDPRLADYCLFPVSGIYRLDVGARLVVAMPSRRPLTLADLRPPLFNHLRTNGEVVVISRGRPDVTDAFIQELIRVAQVAGIELHQMAHQRFGRVEVITLTAHSRSELTPSPFLGR